MLETNSPQEACGNLRVFLISLAWIGVTVGTVLFLALVVAPSAGAAGGCGGG
jgi:hypothetical protein